MLKSIIRKAIPEDITSIIELCEEHANYEGCAFTKHGKSERLAEHLFRKDATLQCLVVDIDGEIKGHATYLPEFSTWDDTHPNFFLQKDKKTISKSHKKNEAYRIGKTLQGF